MSSWLGCAELEAAWKRATASLDALAIPDGIGGINLGDRRALFYLISKLGSASILEVGTHVGASTSTLAAALSAKGECGDKPVCLVSVDVRDVNSPVSKPWLGYGMRQSPAAMIETMGCGDFVEFITEPALDYLSRCELRFDFIFLDGDHTAKAVYQEIPAALRLLEPGGVILLHDFFPGLKPLWPGEEVIPGPFLAMERLVDEGANLTVVSLGELPWPTKLGSKVTSLALLLKKDREATL